MISVANGPLVKNRWLAILCALASGLSLWLAFPGPSVYVLAPAAVAMLLAAVGGRCVRAAVGLGFLCGMAFFVPVLQWSGIYVGALPWFALATSQALFVGLFAAGAARLWRLPGWLAVVGIGAWWVACEGLRARVPFGGFPWARIAFSQVDAPSAAMAGLGGTPALSALVALCGALLTLAVLYLKNSDDTQPIRRLAGAVLVTLAAVALYCAPAALPQPAAAPAGTVTIAAIQGNVPRAGLEFNAQRRAVLDNHARLTRELAARIAAGRQTAPDVVVWPENASDIDPLRNTDATAVIQQAADAVQRPILVGSLLQEPPGKLSNATLVWWPRSAAVPGAGQRYVKRHPVPFAEWIPWRPFFRIFSDKVDLIARDFAAGDAVGVLRIGPAQLGTLICFEVAYDNLVRDVVRANANILVVQTNNATFGYSDESVQQLAISRLRAIETGRSVVHISTVGISALIAPDGKRLVTSGHFTPQILQATLPLRTERTWATRLGVVPEAVLAALGAILVVVANSIRNRRLRPRRAAATPEHPAEEVNS